MLYGIKVIAAFLEVTVARVQTFIDAGAPIRRITTTGEHSAGVRYMAEKEALLRWRRCDDVKRSRSKAG